MLRHGRDWVALAHIAAAAATQALALAHSAWWALPAVLLGAHVMAIEHNHAHVPLARARAVNSVLDLTMALVCGIPLLFWRVHHLGSHHAHTWTDADWSSPFAFRGASGPDRPVSYRYYQLTYYPLFCLHSTIHVIRSRNPRLLRALAANLIVVGGGAVVVVQLFGPVRWLLVMGSTYLLAGLMLGSVNYFEHFNARDRGGDFLAWTFTCRLHNLASYNSGYHLLHHNEPMLHWSELSARHRRDPSYCPRRFLETGLFPGYRTPRGRDRWLEEHGARVAS